jgi:hypothetical protein
VRKVQVLVLEDHELDAFPVLNLVGVIHRVQAGSG